MSTSLRVAAYAWLAGGAAWLAKMLLILQADGGDNVVIGIAFVIGIAALFVAGGAAGYSLLRRWSLWLAVPGTVLGVGLTFVAINLFDSVLQSIVPASGWFDEEVGILGAAIAALLLGLALTSRDRGTKPTSAAVSAGS
jgi:hypothetical protein